MSIVAVGLGTVRDAAGVERTYSCQPRTCAGQWSRCSRGTTRRDVRELCQSRGIAAGYYACASSLLGVGVSRLKHPEQSAKKGEVLGSSAAPAMQP